MLLSSAAQSHPLIQGYIVAQDRSLADHYPCAVIDKESFSDRSSRVNLDPGFARCPLGNPSGPEIMSFLIKLMGKPVPSKSHEK